MTKINCYLYKCIPGAHKNWTLAVFAINRKDADDYVKFTDRGGSFAGEVSSGKVNADCGATTESARAIITGGLL